MPISITINGSITLDESAGLQTGGSATATEDNNDSDISLATLQSGVSSFYNRLFGVGELNLSSAFATANGVARSASNYISLTGTGSVISLGFTSSTGAALPVLGSGTGVSTGLFALDGGAISLFTDPGSELGNRVAYGVDEDGDIVFALFMEPAANLLTARVWMVQFEPLDNPVDTNHDDFLALTGLGVGAGVSTEFVFAGLPSGQNLFGMVGTAGSGIIVFGQNTDLNADGTFTNASNTINTSQGGGRTTIGVNNQMFDPNDGAYFTYVRGANANFLGSNLDANEADDADNMLYSDGDAATNDTIESDGAFLRIAQLQGNGTATMRIDAYNIAGSPQGEDLIDASGQNAVEITRVKVYDSAGNLLADSNTGNAGLITFNLAGLSAVVSGLNAGYKVEWFTNGVHDQVKITGVAGKFDIGGFGINEPSAVSAPLTGVRFEDDGPSITATIVGAPSPTVDETDLLTNDSDSFAAQFTPSYGTDGAAAADPVTYALSTPGGASGLLDTATGQSIVLSLVGGVIQGRTAISNDLCFTVSVDGSGNVSLDQLRAIVHPTADPNESKTLSSAGLVVLTATAHDGDGDTASAPLNIGTQLIFRDDGPSITATIVGAPSPTVDESDLTTNDSDSFSAQFTPDFGEDGAGATPVTYALSTPGGASGLFDTATGQSIVLSSIGGVIQGRTAISNDLCFTVSVDGSGNVSLDQLRAVVHPTADPDESKTLSSAGLVVLTATAHDKDGDSDSAPLNIGTQLIFKDDGPSITASIVGAPSPTVDESALGIDDSDSFAAQFTPDFGEDGAGATPVTYALSTPGGASGLLDTATGQSIVLSSVGGVIQGRTAISDELCFTVSVDGSGNVLLDQLRAVVHPTADPDESKTLASAGLVVLTATAHDKDGDSDSAPLNIGTQLIFKDDGPSITASIVGAPTLTVDESALATDDSDSFAAQFTPVYGADGQGANPVIYELSTSGGNSGIVDTATGNSVFLFVEGGKVVGREGTNATDAESGEIVFEVSVDASGSVTLDQKRAIVHPTLDHDESKSLLAADMVVLIASVTDKDGDSDSAPLNIGQLLVFKDDGPIQPDAGENVPPLVTDDSDVTDDAAVSTADIFPDPPEFGSDGERAIDPIIFSLRLVDPDTNDGDDPDSGLIDTATGKAIRWVQPVAGGDIIGYVDSDGDGEIEAGDPEAVRFSLVPDAGDPPNVDVTFTQTRAVFHALADEEETILGNRVFVERSAFDGDDDTAEVVDFDLSEITGILDDEPAIGPISNGIVDFAINDFVSNPLNGDVGNDSNTSPYTITAFTATVQAGSVELGGVLEDNGTTVTYYEDTDGDEEFGSAGDTAFYRLTLDQVGGGEYTFTVLRDPPPSFTEFDFTYLPSGQSLFGVLVDQDDNMVQDLDGLGLLVVGRDAVIKNPGDGTYTNASDTINTSQGGGAVTIGVDNQMFDPGDGAVFVYLDNPDNKSIAINPESGGGGLTQTSADDADTLGFAGTAEARGGEIEVVQKQGGAVLGMKISAYDVDVPGADDTIVSANDPQSQNPPTTDDESAEARSFIDNPLAGATRVSITGIRVYDRANPSDILESWDFIGGVWVNTDGDGDGIADNAAGISLIHTVVSGANVVEVRGFTPNDTIAWTTAADHDAVLIEGTSGKWDVGGFNIAQGNDTPDQLLEFTAQVTDGDADTDSASWKIGIDGTGIHDDNMVSGVII